MTQQLPPCAQCGERKPIMVVMERAADGSPWQLCSTCWLEGATPYKLGKIPAEYRDDLVVVSTQQGTITTPTGSYTYTETNRLPKDLDPAELSPKAKRAARKKKSA